MLRGWLRGIGGCRGGRGMGSWKEGREVEGEVGGCE